MSLNVICPPTCCDGLMSMCCDEVAEKKTLTEHSIADARRERIMLGEAREEDEEQRSCVHTTRSVSQHSGT